MNQVKHIEKEEEDERYLAKSVCSWVHALLKTWHPTLNAAASPLPSSPPPAPSFPEGVPGAVRKSLLPRHVGGLPSSPLATAEEAATLSLIFAMVWIRSKPGEEYRKEPGVPPPDPLPQMERRRSIGPQSSSVVPPSAPPPSLKRAVTGRDGDGAADAAPVSENRSFRTRAAVTGRDADMAAAVGGRHAAEDGDCGAPVSENLPDSPDLRWAPKPSIKVQPYLSYLSHRGYWMGNAIDL